jgi:hypothetical protein
LSKVIYRYIVKSASNLIMSVEEDLHMALCVVKVLALVVIASSLLSISGSMAGPSIGYAVNGAVTTTNAGKSFNVVPEKWNGSTPPGPSYNSQTSQA